MTIPLNRFSTSIVMCLLCISCQMEAGQTEYSYRAPFIGIQAPPKVAVNREFKVYFDVNDPCEDKDKDVIDSKIDNTAKQVEFTLTKFGQKNLICSSVIFARRMSAPITLDLVGSYRLTIETSSGKIEKEVIVLGPDEDIPDWKPTDLYTYGTIHLSLN